MEAGGDRGDARRVSCPTVQAGGGRGVTTAGDGARVVSRRGGRHGRRWRRRRQRARAEEGWRAGGEPARRASRSPPAAAQALTLLPSRFAQHLDRAQRCDPAHPGQRHQQHRRQLRWCFFVWGEARRRLQQLRGGDEQSVVSILLRRAGGRLLGSRLADAGRAAACSRTTRLHAEQGAHANICLC
ncbi:unnamed protein product [Urochloa humidicola]